MHQIARLDANAQGGIEKGQEVEMLEGNARDTDSNSFTRRPTNRGLLLSTTQLIRSLSPQTPTSSDKNADLHSHALLAWRNAGCVMLGPGTDALLQELPGFATDLAKSFLDCPEANQGGGEIAFDEGGENIAYRELLRVRDGGGGGGGGVKCIYQSMA